MKFKIREKVYDAATLGRPEIRDYLRLAAQTEALGRRLGPVEAEAIANSISECKTDAERKSHPDMLWFIALNVWASLCHAANEARDAGVTVVHPSFEDAIAVSLDDLTFLPDPEDHKPADPSKARTRAASARAAKRPAAAKRAAAKTSKTRSTRGS